ncbi:MAG: hypothetical protein A2Z06_01360 [Candidatus Glassbacteria bacterium RBG_16_58_8]|uniref:Zinc finger CHC2-type domain-containing protein n=1 Tax=Candidatus Glassbacteria bacterium RBG_16_58_8 TaxID=1817866 RepID=A0A1F5YC93_9BACT|nr:MAG: hypothetical protein A2Z06_01360 [Candidatus Glassbacteria bacterium RBG_16_58_8]
MKDYYRRIREVPILQVAEALGIAVRKDKKALCPFHGDKDPSLAFKGNRFHCFGCMEKGSPIDLVMKIKDLGLEEASEWIGSRFRIFPPDKGSPARSRSRKTPASPLPEKKIALPGAITAASPPGKEVLPAYFDVYEKTIALLPSSGAIAYLEGRGIPRDTAAGYMIRIVEDPGKVLAGLLERFSLELLLSSGVVRKKKDGSPTLQWGEGWIIFPFIGRDGLEAGQIVFLQGRNPLPDGIPKYMELAGGFPRPLYWTAKGMGAPEDGELYLCEGIIDALSAEEMGSPAVAVLGTSALSDTIIRTLLPYRLKILADKDPAGGKFAKEASGRIKEMGGWASVVHLPDGVKDGNEFLLQKIDRKGGRK